MSGPSTSSGPIGNGQGKTVEVARRWITAVMQEGDWDQAWALTDPVFRLAQVQAWLWPQRGEAEFVSEDLDEVATSMCEEGPGHPLWEEFSQLALYTFQETWQEFDLERWSVTGLPRPVALDYEVVVFSRQEEEIIRTAETLYVARPFLMHFTESGWLVAHAGSDQPPVPGWPPEFPSASAAT